MNKTFILGVPVLLSAFAFVPTSRASNTTQPAMKPWTLLVFLNGKNNLDTYGAFNINQMEKVGSNDKINVVVQYGSMATPDVTERLYIKQDNDINTVSSPVVQKLGAVDFGDYHSLIDFVQWGVQNYPAQHYFVAVWDHGSGWHLKVKSLVHANDISFDDQTGHAISTKDLGVALAASAKLIGHPIDIYGSDACLMAMAEVAAEMQGSVSYFVGSQETEPGDGWPYDTFLTHFNALPDTNPAAVSKAIVEEYVKAYENGEDGTESVTFAAYDMSKFGAFQTAMADLAKNILSLAKSEQAKLLSAANSTQAFTYSDYKDLLDFLKGSEASQASGLSAQAVTAVRAAATSLIIESQASPSFTGATGLSVWLPTDSETLSSYLTAYKAMTFDQNTHWSDALSALIASGPQN